MGKPPGRMLAVDALRGYAALSVLIFHVMYNSAQADALARSIPSWFYTTLGTLRSGVAVFFVISGFVIGYTTYNLGRRLKDVGVFALRRQIRLDPPYYVAIALVLFLSFVERTAGYETRSFSAVEMLLNMVYLQGFLGAESVLAVAWTLCMEVQFYLVLVLILWVTNRVTLGHDRRRQTVVHVVVLMLAAISISLPFFGVASGPWFIGTWWQFAMGMTVSWFVRGNVSDRFVLVVILLATSSAALGRISGNADVWGGEWFAVGTAALIYLLVRTGRVERDPGRVPLYLGKVSYSLYLLHLPVLTITMGAVLKFMGSSVPALILAVSVGAAASFIAAEMLRRFVEQPSIDLAKWVGQRAAKNGGRNQMPVSGFQGTTETPTV